MNGLKKTDFAAYLNVKNAISPTFGPDSQSVLFLSDITGTLQVWSVPVEGGWPDQLTFYEERVTGLHPKPDSSAFLISRDRGGDEQHQFYLLEGNAHEGVSVTTLLDVPEAKNEFGGWRPNGHAFCFASNQRNPAFYDIYTQEIGNTPQLVYQADATLYAADWSPDGRYILVAEAHSILDYSLFMLDLHEPNSPPRPLTNQPGQSVRWWWNAESRPRFSPDGRYVYALSAWERDFVALVRFDLTTGEMEVLNESTWDIESFALSADGTKLVYTLNEEGYSRLFIRNLSSDATHEQEIAGLPQGVASELSWSPDGKHVLFSFTSPVHNADLWVYELASQQLRQLTTSSRGGLNAASFIRPKLVRYPSFDGLQIPALQFLPEGAKPEANLPFVVLVHGGPESQTRFQWNTAIQFFVSRGYGVLAPNVRGSSGYGKHYMGLDDVHKRMDSVADLKASVEWLQAQGVADPKRIAVYGGSYGGFMVLSALTTYPELWAAGVDIVGIANFVSFFENTSPYRRKQRIIEYGDPQTDHDFLVSISPIHKIDRIAAPLMVIHGARDPRVPIGEAQQIVAGLQERQHPVEYQVFDDEGHGITKLKNKLVVYPAIADFLDKYLLDKV